MSETSGDVSHLSGEDLYSLVNALKREIESFKALPNRVSPTVESIGCQTSIEWLDHLMTARVGQHLSDQNEHPIDGHDSRGSGQQLNDTNVKKNVTNGGTSRRPFKCGLNDCHQKYDNKDALTKHQFRRHPDAFPDKPWIECKRTGCQFRCKLKGDMTTHINNHGYRVKIRCQWKGCKKWVFSQWALDMHMNTHTADTQSQSTGADNTDIECHNSYESSVETIGGSVDPNETNEPNDSEMDCDMDHEFDPITSAEVSVDPIDDNIIENNDNSNIKHTTDSSTQTEREVYRYVDNL